MNEPCNTQYAHLRDYIFIGLFYLINTYLLTYVGGPVVGGSCLHRYLKTCLGAEALPREQQVLHLAMCLVAQIPI